MGKVIYLRETKQAVTPATIRQQIQKGEVIDLDKLTEALRISNPVELHPLALDSFDSVIVATWETQVSNAPKYWGIGYTIREAIRNAKFIHQGDMVSVIRCNHDASIDSKGNFRAGESSPYGISLGRGRVNVYYQVERFCLDVV